MARRCAGVDQRGHETERVVQTGTNLTTGGNENEGAERNSFEANEIQFDCLLSGKKKKKKTTKEIRVDRKGLDGKLFRRLPAQGV